MTDHPSYLRTGFTPDSIEVAQIEMVLNPVNAKLLLLNIIMSVVACGSAGVKVPQVPLALTGWLDGDCYQMTGEAAKDMRVQGSSRREAHAKELARRHPTEEFYAEFGEEYRKLATRLHEKYLTSGEHATPYVYDTMSGKRINWRVKSTCDENLCRAVSQISAPALRKKIAEKVVVIRFQSNP